MRAGLDQNFQPTLSTPVRRGVLPEDAAELRRLSEARAGENFHLVFELSGLLWRECQASRLKPEDILSISRQLEKASANSEAIYKNEGIKDVGTAQDVCSVLHQVLNFIVAKDVSLLQLAARITLEHFENKAYLSLQPESRKWNSSRYEHIEEENRQFAAAWKHPAVQDELVRQESDLAALLLLSQSDDETGFSDFIAGRSRIRADSSDCHLTKPISRRLFDRAC